MLRSIVLGVPLIVLSFAVLAGQPEPPAAERLTDAEIADRLIARSIARYSGNCPCPYSRMRNGRRCGGVSAYSRPGGASPLCYRRDVSAAMIESYRQRGGRK